MGGYGPRRTDARRPWELTEKQMCKRSQALVAVITAVGDTRAARARTGSGQEQPLPGAGFAAVRDSVAGRIPSGL